MQFQRARDTSNGFLSDLRYPWRLDYSLTTGDTEVTEESLKADYMQWYAPQQA